MEQFFLHKNIGLQYKSLATARAEVARTQTNNGGHDSAMNRIGNIVDIR